MLRHLAAGLGLTVCLAAAAIASAAPAPAAQTGATTEPSVRSAEARPPECNGSNSSNCAEYYSWYWTYAACQSAGRQQVADNPDRYYDYDCEGDHGAVVWLWLLRKS